MAPRNRRILLSELPSGRLETRHFSATEAEIPETGPGEVLCRTVLLSIDPANRAWMSGRTYRDQLDAGDVMAGYALSEVVESDEAELPAGSLVLGDSGWQEYAALPARRLRRIEQRSALTHHLRVLV